MKTTRGRSVDMWRAGSGLAQALRNLSRHNRGTTAVEYGLIVGGIAVAIIGEVFVIGEDLAVIFNDLADAFRDAREK